MAFPAPALPNEQWLYVSQTSPIFGTTSDASIDVAEASSLLCYAYAQGYTGVILFNLFDLDHPTFWTGGTTFSATNAKFKLRQFINMAYVMGLSVGGATSTNTNQFRSFEDFNNTSTLSERFSIVAIENEWYWWSYRSASQQPNTGAYSFLTMKNNILSRKAAVNAAGMLIYIYYGWPREAGFDYATITGYREPPDLNPATRVNIGADEITQLQGVCDKHMIHNYTSGERPSYSFTQGRVRRYTYPVDLLFIFSAEPAYSDNFFEGKNASGVLTYLPKTVPQAYAWTVTNLTAASPSGSSNYFNAETNSNVIANVNVVGAVLFSDRWIRPLVSGNGPRVYINAGPDISVGSSPGTVTVTATSCDDGLPPGSVTTFAWALNSGVGGSFTAPTSLTTDFSFPSDGIYELIIYATNSGVTSESIMTLYVNSTPGQKFIQVRSQGVTSVPITVSPADVNGDSNGTTTFIRIYNASTNVTLTAPATFGGFSFVKWLRQSSDYSVTPQIVITDNSSHRFTAVYAPTVTQIPHRMQLTCNVASTPYSASRTDNFGQPIGLSGVMQDVLTYYPGDVVTYTVPAVSQTRALISVTLNGVALPFITAGPNVSFTYTVPSTLAFDTIYVKYDATGLIDVDPDVIASLCSSTTPGTYVGFYINGPVRTGNNFEVKLYSGWGTPGQTLIFTFEPPFTALPTAPGGNYYSSTSPGVAYGFTFHDNGIGGAPAPDTTLGPLYVSYPPPLVLTQVNIPSSCSVPLPSSRASATGGTPPYSYAWITLPGLVPAGSTDTLVDVAGSYRVTVTDGNGCQAVLDVTLVATTALFLDDEIVTQQTCSTGGLIAIEVSGGIAPYTYAWEKDGSPYGTNSNTQTNLPEGEYYVVVTAPGGCTSTFGPWEIDALVPLSVNIVSDKGIFVCDSQEITLTADVSNGTPVYTYLWNTGATTSSLFLGFLPSGTSFYSVVVTDSNGCQASNDIILTVAIGPSDDIVITLDTAPSACSGTDYELSSTGTGAFASFVWMPTLETTTDISGLSSSITVPTEFYIIGTATGGCTKESNRITVLPSPATQITLGAVTSPVCNGAPDAGAIDVTVAGGCAPYTYAWTGPGGFTATTQDISGLITGVYDLVVTDSLLQTDSLSVNLVVSNPVVAVAVTNSGCPGVNNGSITASTTGGTPPYTYLWNNGRTTATITGLAPGAFEVTATDANGCVSSIGAQISESTAVTVSFRTRNPSSAIVNDGQITAIPAGGVTPYAYLWNTGDTADTIVNLPAGTYTVQVTDANGCQCVGQATLITDEQAQLADLTCCYGEIAYQYVYQMQNGLHDKAKCTMARLKLLNRFISDLCNYEAGTCLTDAQYQSIKEKARYICKCCGCGDDPFDDTILP